MDKKFIAYSGYAALVEIRSLIAQSKHREAIDLTRCTYKFLMAHEGLDDPTEISIGFQLCLIMANRGEHVTKDKATHDAMLELSQKILGEVFDICKASKIDLTKCQLSELDDLISVVGEQRDYKRLEVCFFSLDYYNIGLISIVASYIAVVIPRRAKQMVTVNGTQPWHSSCASKTLRRRTRRCCSSFGGHSLQCPPRVRCAT